MGVRKYMEGLAGKRSRMKCYISAPTEVEGLHESRWRVLHIDCSRNHMAAVAVRESEPP
jgi:hypothetical protein